jgi:PAS domain S-box-containing protein
VKNAGVSCEDPPFRPRLAVLTSISVITLGGLGLLGYAIGVRAVAQIVPAGPVFAPGAAVMLVAAGAGLWLVAPQAAATARRRAGRLLGVVIALYGAAILIEYLARRDLGIDTVLFANLVQTWSDADTPGRPAPHTALALVATGSALAMLDTDASGGYRPARVLAPSAAVVAGVALLGHAYGLTYLSGTSTVNAMPYAAAAAFVSLTVGLLACRPERTAARVFLGHGPGGVTVRRLAPVVLATILLVGVLLNATGRPALSHHRITVTAVVALLVGSLYLMLLRAGDALNQADRELRDARDFSQMVLHSLQDGVLTIGADGAVLEVTPRWCEITGFSAPDATGCMRPYPWWPARLRTELTARSTAAVAGHAPVEFETLLCRPDGTEVAVLITMSPVHDRTGRRMLVGTCRDLTERNEVETRRRRAAEQLNHFFSISTDLLCIAGTDGYFKQLNPAWEHALGYTTEELMRVPYVDLLHPDDVARTACETAAQAREGKVTISFENRYRCRNGSYRWLNWNAVPSPTDGLVYAVARDTTEQRRNDVVRTQLAAIVDGTDDAIIGMDLAGIITSWNPAAELHYGYRAEEATGQSIRLIVPAPELDELQPLLDNVMRGAPIRHHDMVQVRKDGTRMHVAVSLSAIRDHTGTVVGAASIARDISDRIRAEERFRQLVLAAPDAMIIVDERGDIVLTNDQTERLFGYAAAELVGQSIEILVPAPLRDVHALHRQGYLDKPEIRQMGTGTDLVGLRRDGTEVPIEISLAPLDTDQGRLVSAAVRDITERRHVEQAAAHAHDEALAAAQLKSQFVAMVSHEIRTPMNGVIGLAELLLKTGLRPGQRRYVEAIRTSGRALLTIINDILDFSKIEAGKVELVETDFELDQLLEEVIQVAADAGRDKDLEILMYYPPDMPTVLHGDQGRLRQALLNLLGNAVKFTERGEVLLRADPDDATADGRPHITFAVIDTGIGIAPQHLSHLCDPFSQVDAAPNREFGGTGLGLTITRQLIELMGGQLDIDSRPGQGSRFSFSLPVTPSLNPPMRHRHPKDHIAGRRILVVDDNSTSRHLMTEHTRAWGMIPTVVSDGRTALEHLNHVGRHQAPYDVAVIDQRMPGLDGISLTNRIITDPTIAPLKVVLLISGAHDDDHIAAELQAGDVLPKPVGPSQLYNCLLALLDPAAAHAAEHDHSPPPHNAADGRGLILLAEDNRINEMVAVDTLAMLGYEVDVAHNGLEALQLATTKHYQAILMDCQMPKMDGYSATSELRHREHAGHRIPIIAMTAGALAADKERCLAAGMDDYLTKPIDIDQLQVVFDRWIVGNAQIKRGSPLVGDS